MAISNIYSKRQKKLRGEINDVYSYNEIPIKLRVQIVHIINDTIGGCTKFMYMNKYGYNNNHQDEVYRQICCALRREYGEFQLSENSNSYYDEICDCFLDTRNVEKCLDIIELTFSHINEYVREHSRYFKGNPDEAISDLNERLKENGVGYQFEQNEIIRVDSTFIHSEVVRPTLKILSGTDEYEGALGEFMSAHEHYRHGKYKESLNDSLKSFESLMKAIHDKNNWEYNSYDTASKLINSCLKNNLIPSYLQSQFTSLKTMLETGIPTIRNKNSGHGQGAEVTVVDEELVSYMLHLTATNLLFLAKCEQKL
ncbi:hypothetical protein H4F45_05025 [Pectobacterium brasiliense]|uniref:Cytoplasmic protein n=1 Tax=Pectobacterium brasiliense TaxID=180957 RepID=A0AAE2WDY9_9GAMM|nr:hypothetical protein [Pectobacterium brasiliense]MBN3050852.1 hypothetical protein [Pectobacterium brasiliense]